MHEDSVATGYAKKEVTEELSKEVEALLTLVEKALGLVGAENRPQDAEKGLPAADKVESLAQKLRSANADIRLLHSVLAKI